MAGGAHPSPFPHAHVVTTTTHKTLRGPRGGMILTNDEDLAKKINSAIFPGLQGGPLMHVIAAKAVAFHEALTPEFKAYAHAVVANAKAMAEPILEGGYELVTGGTDNHLMLVDLTPKGLTGKAAEAALGRAHITCNKNGMPFDPAEADGDLGHPARLARRHVARFRDGGIRRGRPADRRDPGRLGGERRIGECRGRGESARACRRADAPLPDLLGDRTAGKGRLAMRCPYCGGLDTQVKDSAADGRLLVDPPPPRLPGLRRPLHHLRARAVARTHGGQEKRPARAVRPRQAHAFGPGRARKRSVEPERVERMVNGIVRQLESQTDGDIPTERIGELVMEGLKALDDVAYVRFASVYRNFREARDFNTIVGELEGEPEAAPVKEAKLRKETPAK